jgi:nucleotidyltransferase substrate binding protein (TIGR01987 family)
MAANDPDVRWKQRFRYFQKAFDQLKSAAALSTQRDLSDLEKQGLIKAFEFSYELAWKTLKDILKSRAVQNILGPRDAIKKAFASDLIEDGETWLEMIDSRNRSSHTYDPRIADDVIQSIHAKYLEAFARFEERLVELENSLP